MCEERRGEGKGGMLKVWAAIQVHRAGEQTRQQRDEEDAVPKNITELIEHPNVYQHGNVLFVGLCVYATRVRAMGVILLLLASCRSTYSCLPASRCRCAWWRGACSRCPCLCPECSRPAC